MKRVVGKTVLQPPGANAPGGFSFGVFRAEKGSFTAWIDRLAISVV
ncbi:hypothetical protein TRIP_E220084 [uncultured Spirochaetota bacterium]|nr:hypothetical protein TRIP_E220084 [uncultured Spirochaetota bacterium]